VQREIADASLLATLQIVLRVPVFSLDDISIEGIVHCELWDDRSSPPSTPSVVVHTQRPVENP